jgi:cytochrome c biogenesis protein CcmG/thiol:disulfide interchange protein DsbE
MTFARIFARRVRRPLALAGVALLAASFRYAPVYAAASQALPGVTFRTAQDETVRTDDLKGDVVFVDLWATNCKACAAMRAAAERLNGRFAAQGVRFLSVNEDAERKTWKDYLIHNPSPLIEVWDENHSFRLAMRLPGLPAAFVVDRSGWVRWRSPKWNGAAEAQAAAQIDSILREPQPK